MHTVKYAHVCIYTWNQSQSPGPQSGHQTTKHQTPNTKTPVTFIVCHSRNHTAATTIPIAIAATTVATEPARRVAANVSIIGCRKASYFVFFFKKKRTMVRLPSPALPCKPPVNAPTSRARRCANGCATAVFPRLRVALRRCATGSLGVGEGWTWAWAWAWVGAATCSCVVARGVHGPWDKGLVGWLIGHALFLVG